MGKICPICNTYDAKHQGALNMHMYHCKMKHSTFINENVSRGTEQQKQEGCSHEWRFLNLKAPIEKRAFENGYIEVCKKCHDLKGYDE